MDPVLGDATATAVVLVAVDAVDVVVVPLHFTPFPALPCRAARVAHKIKIIEKLNL